ncbi:hypothetical protein GX563_11905 [Candidatus Bathyarchaeota archaeon]|nr:hypothetical protein [Candidatus Bathyarchaeota archaeon]
MPEVEWNKPVICIFRERPKPESEPIAVARARKIKVNQTGDSALNGAIEDFFSLMGDLDYLNSPEGKTDRYVLCWFDDSEPDMAKDFRKLRGVAFNGAVTCSINERSQKRTYNARFSATQGKLK